MCNKSLELIVYYINDTKLSYEELKRSLNTVTGYIQVVFNKDENEMNIVTLKTNIQSKGYGSFLLYYAMVNAMSKNIEKVVLDDVSDRYRDSSNIYTKYGLKYKQDDCPEMEGFVAEILEKFSTISFKTKLLTKTFSMEVFPIDC